MMKMLEQLRIGRAFFSFVKTPGPDAAFALSDAVLACRDEAPALEVAKGALKDPGFRDLFETGYAPLIDPKLLKPCPAGSLGHGFLTHIEQGGYRIDFYPPRDPKTPVGYLALRELQTHDILHVLTGYTTDFADEMALQAFMLSQHRSGLSAALLAAGMLHQLRARPTGASSLMEKMSEGFERGKRARFLLGIPWEKRWQEPLEALRLEAGL